VRRMRYFYGNTFLDGQSFDYHAKPIAILKGRLIIFGAYVLFVLAIQAVPLLIFPLIIAMIFGIPWIIMKARRFQMRVTSYRNLRFNFHGDYNGAMGAFVGWYFLTALTAGIIFPKWLHRRVEYTLDNTAYGKTRFRFVTPSGRFWGFCYATAGMTFIAYLLLIAVVSVSAKAGAGAGGTFDPEGSPLQLFSFLGVTGVLMVLLVAAAGMGIWGFYQARFANAAWGGIEIGRSKVVSQQEAWPLAWIEITNVLGMICTLGLFYPWAKVRTMRYQLQHTSLDTAGGLAEFEAARGEAGEALGEELGEFFDVDFGI
jgi:uncharacterized membrane protein YjgN (DUF898 family)